MEFSFRNLCFGLFLLPLKACSMGKDEIIRRLRGTESFNSLVTFSTSSSSAF